jgi:hypothetical protein
MNTMIQDHREAIRVLEAQSKAHGANAGAKQPGTASGREKPAAADRTNYSIEELRRDLDTSDFAIATLPMMRQHLQAAEDIQKQLQPR